MTEELKYPLEYNIINDEWWMSRFISVVKNNMYIEQIEKPFSGFMKN